VSNVSEFTNVVVNVVAAAPADNADALFNRKLLFAVNVLVVISVAAFNARTPTPAVASDTAKLVPVPDADASTTNHGTIERFGKLLAPAWPTAVTPVPNVIPEAGVPAIPLNNAVPFRFRVIVPAPVVVNCTFAPAFTSVTTFCWLLI
jgi:hypothetical protein